MFRSAIEIISILAAVLCWIHYYFYSGKSFKKVFLFFGGAIFLGTISEVVTIVVTGSYNYPGFNWYIGPVPVFIAIGWSTSFYFTWHVANQLTFKLKEKKWFLLVNGLVAGTIGILIDLYFDPVAVTLEWWTWENGSAYFNVPLANYAGWLFFCGGFAPAYNFIYHRDWKYGKQLWVFALLLIGVFIMTAAGTFPFL